MITVIGTGTMDGSQVIFGSDGKTYQLSQVMAVGRLPEIEGSTVKDYTVSSGNKPSDTTTSTDNKTESSTSKPSTDNKTENTDKTETDNKTESSGTDAAEEGKEPADSTEVPGDRPTDSADTTGNSDSEEKADDSVQPPAEVG